MRRSAGGRSLVRRLRLGGSAIATLALAIAAPATARPEASSGQAARPNVVFILVDDLRYDALGFMTKGLRTPNIDRLAREGAHFRNAFVTTALCSPSRASILTGRYMHDHRVVDNNEPVPRGTRFFPQLLQGAGYQTAFVGKWHMGDTGDTPQPGFDRWVSFAGQGEYQPVVAGVRQTLNVDGRRVARAGYMTGELTNYATDWLRTRDHSRPFFLYLSHKGVHADFIPEARYAGSYAGTPIPLPPEASTPPPGDDDRPMWVKNQRNSWHGVDFAYHGRLDLAAYVRRYYETLMSVDDSVGQVLDALKRDGADRNTVVMFMGDNGFMFGEHGLIDKRAAYEESMRVPLLMRAPGIAAPGSVVTGMAANIDIAPTVLDLAGVPRPGDYPGRSLVPALRGRGGGDERQELLYEYYWEYNYPQTPTTFALRTPRYKFIQYHGVWDTEELFDLQADPREQHNLIGDPQQQPRKIAMRARLFALLGAGGAAHAVPYTERKGQGAVFSRRGGTPAGEFPRRWQRDPDPKDAFDHYAPEQALPR
jgi:N-acetylglucosamine-6-sulfatase